MSVTRRNFPIHCVMGYHAQYVYSCVCACLVIYFWSFGTQPATAHPDWHKCFPVGNGRRAGQEDCFLNPFVHRRTAVAHSEPTKAFSKQSPETAMLSAPFGCTHPPPPVPPFLLLQSLQEVTSQEESFMPDISGYIRERVKQI